MGMPVPSFLLHAVMQSARPPPKITISFCISCPLKMDKSFIIRDFNLNTK